MKVWPPPRGFVGQCWLLEVPQGPRGQESLDFISEHIAGPLRRQRHSCRDRRHSPLKYRWSRGSPPTPGTVGRPSGFGLDVVSAHLLCSAERCGLGAVLAPWSRVATGRGDAATSPVNRHRCGCAEQVAVLCTEMHRRPHQHHGHTQSGENLIISDPETFRAGRAAAVLGGQRGSEGLPSQGGDGLRNG